MHMEIREAESFRQQGLFVQNSGPLLFPCGGPEMVIFQTPVFPFKILLVLLYFYWHQLVELKTRTNLSCSIYILIIHQRIFQGISNSKFLRIINELMKREGHQIVIWEFHGALFIPEGKSSSSTHDQIKSKNQNNTNIKCKAKYNRIKKSNDRSNIKIESKWPPLQIYVIAYSYCEQVSVTAVGLDPTHAYLQSG